MLAELDWLPQPPEDFRARLKSFESELADGFGAASHERLTALATTALDEVQLTMLAKFVARIDAGGGPIEPLMRAKVALLGDGTLSLCAAPIIGSGLRHGLLLDVVEGQYGAAVQEATDRSSPIHRAAPDFALICPDARMLGLDRAAPNEDEARARVAGAFAHLTRIAEGLRPAVRRSVVVQTLPSLPEALFGSFDRVHLASSFAMIEALNVRLAGWAARGEIILLDIARLAASVGLERWHAPDHWHASKLAFSPELLPLYADHVARTLAAALGRGRKCLVLDLDNTCWGGVIGDDGVEGIILGQGSADGEAFVAVQNMALELHDRGIILAVCSKNEEEAARQPFREHPEMLLREDHIAVFQANWTDKAANLRVIAQTLNIGLEALVLLDDNPAERLQVRDALPMVGVPELPNDPSLYPRVLAAAGYFEATAFSREDRDRASYYRADSQRATALSASGGVDAYLASLEMVCRIAPVDALSRPRVAQLINKSNQFNLTTRRYTESEVATAEQDPGRYLIAVRLADRFGDNGLISVVIADKRGDAWEIDTWLMSCRVLGRRVQEAVLAHLAGAASADGASRLVGRYKPTVKNHMVASHYESLGFRQTAAADDGETVWELSLPSYRDPDLPMRVEHTALAKTKATHP